MKSFHVPLPLPLYQKLREVSENLDTPATELARNAIIVWLKEQEKQNINNAITTFALEYGGTEFDLDKDFEEASLELMRKENV